MHIKKIHIRVLFYSLLCYSLIACTSLSTRQYIAEVNRLGLLKNNIQTESFPLVYYSKREEKFSDILHVYIGGDGIPWQDYIFKSEDPEPYDSLVLQLMKQDSQTSIYLGRPCYQGLAKTPPCQPEHWTSARFSKKIVGSMSSALKQLQDRYHYKKLVLIGYSGGGALAVLLAHELPETIKVITIAGNLDTEAWTSLHFYSPLVNSVNPAKLGALAASIQQIHLQGDKDENIPPGITKNYLSKQKNTTVMLFDDADHACCWHLRWPQILSELYK